VNVLSWFNSLTSSALVFKRYCGQAVEDDDTFGDSDSSDNDYADYDPESRRQCAAHHANSDSDDSPQSRTHFAVPLHSRANQRGGGQYGEDDLSNSSEIDLEEEEHTLRAFKGFGRMAAHLVTPSASVADISCMRDAPPDISFGALPTLSRPRPPGRAKGTAGARAGAAAGATIGRGGGGGGERGGGDGVGSSMSEEQPSDVSQEQATDGGLHSFSEQGGLRDAALYSFSSSFYHQHSFSDGQVAVPCFRALPPGPPPIEWGGDGNAVAVGEVGSLPMLPPLPPLPTAHGNGGWKWVQNGEGDAAVAAAGVGRTHGGSRESQGGGSYDSEHSEYDVSLNLDVGARVAGGQGNGVGGGVVGGGVASRVALGAALGGGKSLPHMLPHPHLLPKPHLLPQPHHAQVEKDNLQEEWGRVSKGEGSSPPCAHDTDDSRPPAHNPSPPTSAPPLPSSHPSVPPPPPGIHVHAT